ncbi:FecCD family ABC transporter permease [Actinomycetospora straminea]|uniref:Iron chelate uptake ABC transporter family permease subunit n=1 Tax=Actinomycetospora straminea TaxID=663607 RepID=A0ABP9EWP6_9PSEU|nr:iron chelate uptake ABC transporter family permease subunit [Actinomycetospora straminea]MDD7933610.1 iron chelate uptake ABC transporter family permease subunit [Actinomycetospora straminea]
MSAPVAGRRPLRAGPVSAVWRPRTAFVVLGGLALLVLVGAASVGRGEYPIALADVLRVLAGAGSRGETFVITQLRLPRVLCGVLVGAALGVAGAITQGVARNPLTSPDVLGVTDGAGVAALAVLVLAGTGGSAVGLLAAVGLPLAALVGGLLAAALVVGLAYRQGLDAFRFILVGLGISVALVSVTSWLLVLANVQQASLALIWLRGSLNARGWEHVVPVAVVLVIVLPIAIVLAFRLDALDLGDDAARGLGERVDRSRVQLLGLAVVLAASACAAAGPIRFVALVTPQVSLRLTGGSRPPLLASAVAGALLVVTGDLVARTVLGGEVPVGVVTVVLGAPYLLYLLVRRTRKDSA